MRRRFLGSPPWVRGAASGAFFGMSMSAVYAYQSSIAVGVVLAVPSGIVFGLCMWWFVRRAEGEAFSGSTLTAPGSRADVVLGAFEGPPPDDPEARAATIRLLEHHRRRERRMRWWALPMFGFLAALGVYFALTESPWWWFNVAVFLGACAFFLWSARRTTERLALLRAGTPGA